MSVTFRIANDEQTTVSYNCMYCDAAGCEHCNHTGMEVFLNDKHSLNVSNINASTVVRILGVQTEDPCFGSLDNFDIPAARKNVANALLNRYQYCREMYSSNNFTLCGIDEDMIQYYCESLLELLEIAENKHENILWS